MKGHVLLRARTHLKVPGRSLVWNALLTKKLPMFLSCLNEINGGCEKILPVSGSFWSNFKLFGMMDFTAWLWGWMECYYYSPSGTFVVLTADQFVGRDDGLLEQQRWDSHVCRRNRPFSSDFKEKSESSLHKRRSLRNWEQGMEFLTCDGCEDEYSK